MDGKSPLHSALRSHWIVTKFPLSYIHLLLFIASWWKLKFSIFWLRWLMAWQYELGWGHGDMGTWCRGWGGDEEVCSWSGMSNDQAGACCDIGDTRTPVLLRDQDSGLWSLDYRADIVTCVYEMCPPPWESGFYQTRYSVSIFHISDAPGHFWQSVECWCWCWWPPLVAPCGHQALVTPIMCIVSCHPSTCTALPVLFVRNVKK